MQEGKEMNELWLAVYCLIIPNAIYKKNFFDHKKSSKGPSLTSTVNA